MKFEFCPKCGSPMSHCTCKSHVHQSESETTLYSSLLEKSTIELVRLKERIDQIILSRQVSEGE